MSDDVAHGADAPARAAPGAGAGEVEVSSQPRPADLRQLVYVYAFHLAECHGCVWGEPCVMGRRLTAACAMGRRLAAARQRARG